MKLREISIKYNYDKIEEIANVLSFIGQFTCLTDLPYKAAYPIETLCNKTGTIESLVILAAALFNILGHDCIIIESRLEDRTSEIGLAVGNAAPYKGNFFEESDIGKVYFYYRAEYKIVDQEKSLINFHLGEFVFPCTLASYTPVYI